MREAIGVFMILLMLVAFVAKVRSTALDGALGLIITLLGVASWFFVAVCLIAGGAT